MAARAGLFVVAARLHVPEEGLAQLNGRGLVGEDSIHSEYRRNRHCRKRTKRTQWNHHLSIEESALGTNMAVIAKYHHEGDNHDGHDARGPASQVWRFNTCHKSYLSRTGSLVASGTICELDSIFFPPE